LVEKVITLENVSLVDFLGVENRNINELSSAFPKSKIISRGNEIRIQGSTPEIIRINQIVHSPFTSNSLSQIWKNHRRKCENLFE